MGPRAVAGGEYKADGSATMQVVANVVFLKAHHGSAQQHSTCLRL